jgi:hypothetical protein
VADHVGLTGDGWVTFQGTIQGWESHIVHVRAVVVDGDGPRVVGLRIEPRFGEVAVADAVLTSNRLRGLPVTSLASKAVAMNHLDIAEAAKTLEAIKGRERKTSYGRNRSSSAEEVADVYVLAQKSGIAPRSAVCDALHMSSRTADRYIKQARNLGLIPPYREGRQS